MTVTATNHDRWAEAFQHEALFYAGLDDFLSGTVPFLREGLDGDEPMLVAVPELRLRALQGELAGDADRISFVDMGQIGRNPAHIIPAWSDFLRNNGGGRVPVRGIGEPIWAGRTDDELVECQRHETLLNVAFATSGDLAVMADPFDAPLPPAPLGAEMLPFGLADIAAARNLVSLLARASGLSDARSNDLVLAAHELVSNSIRHGGGAGTIRVWHDGHSVVCEVTDNGRIGLPLAGRQLPSDDSLGGRGLWMANQLCDLVQIRTFAEGSVVRLHMRTT